MAELIVAPKGLEGVVVEETTMSRVDGLAGELIYRGYPIDQLANCRFEEICHLFLLDRLPNASELTKLEEKLRDARTLPTLVQDFIARAPSTDHPMATLRSAVSMLSMEFSDLEGGDRETFQQQAIAMVSKVATVVAAIQRARRGLPPVAPDPKLGHAENLLYMMNAQRPDDVVARTLDVCLVLHADHGFNASTFSTRVVASSESDLVSAVTAGVGSLKGPLHGGANTAVMKMLQEIGSVENVEPWLERALAEKRKIMGFGHRVYKVLDPRAIHLKRMSEEWGRRVGNVKWFDMSMKLEALMLEKKNIYPNVDFYSASTYFAMGIEPDMYTPIFAVARMLGWCAHFIEQRSNNRIFRPKASYVGPLDQVAEPLAERA